MTEERGARGSSSESFADDEIARLLREAGPRPPVPEEEITELLEDAHARWRRKTLERTRRRRWLWAGGLAAAALLLAVMLPRWRAHDVRPTVVATFALVDGVVDAEGPEESWRPRDGDPADDHTTVTTAGGTRTGRAALRLAGGVFVRLDEDTRLRLVSPSRVELENGAIYVDSGSEGAKIEVLTAWGTARNLGTRFEVRIRPGSGPALRVRVRAGAVAFEREGETSQVGRGEELTLLADGSMSKAAAEIHGPEWSWIRAAAPTFHIEGRTLRDFLHWITAENGWTLESAPAVLTDDVLGTVLSGDIEGLAPEEAIEVVLLGSGLRHRLVAGVLSIDLEPEP